jgi:probable phosphoglycerate mutase
MAITTELIVVRHAEAECNRTGRVGGEKGCTGLTPKGHAQSNFVAARLAEASQQRAFDVVICSTRLRCKQTGSPIASQLDMTMLVEHELRGPDHGLADGRQWSEIKAAFGSALQHQPDKVIAEGGESWNQYLARAASALDRILRRHDGQRILVVAHGETIEAAHTLLLQLPPGMSSKVWFNAGHTAIAHWQLQVNVHGRKTWLFEAHNDRSHLPPSLR